MSHGGLASSVGAAMLAAILAGCATSPPPLTTSELVAGMGRQPDSVQPNALGGQDYVYAYERSYQGKDYQIESHASFDPNGACVRAFSNYTVYTPATSATSAAGGGYKVIQGPLILDMPSIDPPPETTAQFDAATAKCQR